MLGGGGGGWRGKRGGAKEGREGGGGGAAEAVGRGVVRREGRGKEAGVRKYNPAEIRREKNTNACLYGLFLTAKLICGFVVVVVF